MTNDEWDSKRIIGNVKEAYKEFKTRQSMTHYTDYPRRDKEWIAFYNGWLEGRIDMLGQIKGIIDDKK